MDVHGTGKLPLLDVSQLIYSEKYTDDLYEYRHVMIPKEFAKYIPRTHLMSETEWRNLGIQQSPGWEHYLVHTPEPHVLMFRRARTDVPANGLAFVDPNERNEVYQPAPADTSATGQNDVTFASSSLNVSDPVDVSFADNDNDDTDDTDIQQVDDGSDQFRSTSFQPGFGVHQIF